MQLHENAIPFVRPSAPPPPHRALVVAGEAHLREAMIRSVTSHGYVATAVADGLEALAELTDADAGGPLYELVVAARDLPDMTGRELADTVNGTLAMATTVIALP